MRAGTDCLAAVGRSRSDARILGHVDRKLDWDYHLALARTGAYLGYDQISKEKYAPDARRLEFILRLVAGGTRTADPASR